MRWFSEKETPRSPAAEASKPGRPLKLCCGGSIGCRCPPPLASLQNKLRKTKHLLLKSMRCSAQNLSTGLSFNVSSVCIRGKLCVDILSHLAEVHQLPRRPLFHGPVCRPLAFTTEEDTAAMSTAGNDQRAYKTTGGANCRVCRTGAALTPIIVKPPLTDFTA